MSANLADIFTKPSSKYTYLMRGIAQQRLLLDHALGHAQSHISWSNVRIEFRILHGFPMEFRIFHGFAPSLWCIFDNCSGLSLIYHSHLRIRLGNCSSPDKNRLASKCSFGRRVDITRHPPSHSCWEAPAEVNHAAQTLLESTGVELEVVPSGYRPESRHMTRIGPAMANIQKWKVWTSLKVKNEENIGKPETMVSLYGFPMVSLWFPYGFPMVSLWFPYSFPKSKP